MTSQERTITGEVYAGDDLSVLLKQYYKHLFPTKLYHRWLQYGIGSKDFENREFSFTLKDDIYIRYLSFSDHQELDKELQKRVPYKIDIGAIYNYKPKENKTLQAGVFKPMEKELVFDIDMTDYDDVRTCCSGAAICGKCWPFMTLALKIIDKTLEEDFGFHHRLWVYSGRRGIHCWVADKAARELSQQGRSAVAEYISVIKGGESQTKKVTFRGSNLHPSLSRSSDLVRKFFTEQYLREQDILSSKEQRTAMLKLVTDEGAREKIEESWNKNGNMTSSERWMILEQILEEKFSKNRFVALEIMFQYVYPRLDINVSKGLNHLLKSPFCIHPKTGRVCVPIDPKIPDAFNPETVPTISQLLQELDVAKSSHMDTENETKTTKDDFMRTSLKEGIQLFRKFVAGLEKENNERKRTTLDEKNAQNLNF